MTRTSYLFYPGMAAVIMAAGVLASMFVSDEIEAEPAFTPEEVEAAKESIALSLMGQLQMSVSDLMWLKSMEYLHIGIEQRPLTQQEERAGVQAWGGETAPVGLSHSATRNMMLDRHEDWRGFFGELDRQVRPYAVDEHGNTLHIHDDPVELIPWYQLAVRLNPHLERLYTLGAFYMADFASEPDEAFELLMAGVKANPYSVEINYALGRLLYDYRHRLEALEHHHDTHHDHHHHWHHGDDCDGHHHFDDIPDSAEAALLMAVEYLHVAVDAAERQRERHRERGGSFDEFGEQAHYEAYLFLSRALMELDRLDEALEAAETGFQKTMHNLLRVQQRVVQRRIDGEVPEADDADAGLDSAA